MPYAFRLGGKDRRLEYVKAFDGDRTFITQKISGPDVEHFQPDIGFCLIAQQEPLKFYNADGTPDIRAWRIRNVAELSLGPQLDLREFYYTMRNRPKLAVPFSTTENIYNAVLQSIIHTEIACDVERAAFSVGNRPQGSIFYAHNSSYGNEEKLIGFTENLARGGISPWEVQNAMSVVHLEKNSAAGRLHKMKFSALTNSIITTCGGNFTRAVYALAARFAKEKPMVFFCDADAYGNDMLRTLEYGSMNSRHVTLDQAFPPADYPNIYMAGLFPSVAEEMGLPNDIEQKRPLANKHVRDRIEFMQRYDMVDQRDVDTWARDKTYELVGAFVARFKDRHGSIVCKELLGYDLNNPQEREAAKEKGLFDTLCPQLVRDATEIIEEIL